MENWWQVRVQVLSRVENWWQVQVQVQVIRQNWWQVQVQVIRQKLMASPSPSPSLSTKLMASPFQVQVRDLDLDLDLYPSLTVFDMMTMPVAQYESGMYVSIEAQCRCQQMTQQVVKTGSFGSILSICTISCSLCRTLCNLWQCKGQEMLTHITTHPCLYASDTISNIERP